MTVDYTESIAFYEGMYMPEKETCREVLESDRNAGQSGYKDFRFKTAVSLQYRHKNGKMFY